MSNVFAETNRSPSNQSSGKAEALTTETIASTRENSLVQKPSAYSFWIGLMPFFFIAVSFYLIMIRPAKRRMEEHQNVLDNLKEGDKVVVCGGIFGVIIDVKEKVDGTIAVSIGNGIVVRVVKKAIGLIS